MGKESRVISNGAMLSPSSSVACSNGMPRCERLFSWYFPATCFGMDSGEWLTNAYVVVDGSSDARAINDMAMVRDRFLALRLCLKSDGLRIMLYCADLAIEINE